MLGILLIDKPKGISSHSVVNIVRRRLGIKRIGHAGTLDPLATGVLVIAVGPATRFLQYLPLEPKVYVARLQFGVSTTTFDAEGEVTHRRQVPGDLEKAVEAEKGQFMGLIEQIPPMYSAVKVDGEALYKKARRGEVIAREARTVHVSELTVSQYTSDSAVATIVCSGGTYIRSLANDLGDQVGCGAHLAGLVRTNVGKFAHEDCKDPEQVGPNDILPLSEALPPMPLIQLDAQQTAHLREGRSVRVSCTPSNSLVGLQDPAGSVFSVARLLGNLVQPECVIPGENLADAV